MIMADHQYTSNTTVQFVTIDGAELGLINLTQPGSAPEETHPNTSTVRENEHVLETTEVHVPAGETLETNGTNEEAL